MAENKKGFVLYADQKSMFDKLPDEIAGKLIKHIFSYVCDENKPIESTDLILQIAFEPIKTQLKRDLQKWEEVREKRKQAGLQGGRPKSIENQTEAKKSNGFFDKQTEAKKAVIVNVNDKVKVNVNDNVNVINEKESTIDFYQTDFFTNKNIEPICMQLGISVDKYNELKKTFYALQIESGKKYTAFNELKSHWANWLSIQAKEVKKDISTAQKRNNGLPLGMIHHQTKNMEY